MGHHSQIERVREAANRQTYERRRAEAMGFTFGEAQVIDRLSDDGFLVRMMFRCVCGKEECISLAFSFGLVDALFARFDDEFDIVGKLRRLGSFSRAHLLKDGYTVEQVSDILAKGEQFDRENACQSQ